eukprot:TRINITY_DN650_c0_g1_i2.p2 TRINITY_DN650_c0_g1~~TRINITY_DN650_c0_g1_i2.p2  ORF type:complete len:125 (-),score=58.62 TRINITY_DN650_c0_g1_i2:25-399(-)
MSRLCGVSTCAASFRACADVRDAERARSLLRDATETATMLESIDAMQELHVKYNIGTAVDERERIRKTAARVGLGIPEWNDPQSTVLDKYHKQLHEDATEKADQVAAAEAKAKQADDALRIKKA